MFMFRKEAKKMVAYNRYNVKLVLTAPMLGGVPMDEEVYTKYIRGKNDAPPKESTEDEIETLSEEIENKTTGFHRMEDGTPLVYNYLIRGFFKAACSALRRVKGTESKAIVAYRKIIDGLVFVYPRRIPLVLPEGEALKAAQSQDKVLGLVWGEREGIFERAIRVNTAQGERVAMARSECVPAGTTLQFVVKVAAVSEELLREWFEYGQDHGLGQWRSGGWGSFVFEMTTEK